MHDQKKGDGRGKILILPTARQMAKGKELAVEPKQNEAANKLLIEGVKALDEKKVKEALKVGGYPGLYDEDENTLLHLTGYAGHYGISKLLIDYANAMGINIVNVLNKQDKSPMDMVLDGRGPESGEHAKVLALMRMNNGKWHSPDIALQIGDRDEAQRIVGNIIMAGLVSELLVAASELDLDYTKKLMRATVDINPTLHQLAPTNPLAMVISLAMENELTERIAEFAQHLVDFGAKVDAPFMPDPSNPKYVISLIQLTRTEGIAEDIQHLLRCLYDRQLANELFLAAAANNDIYLAESAIRKGACTEARSEEFDAAAHISSARGHLEFFDFLAECNADLGVVTDIGSTLIHTSVYSGKPDMLRHVTAAMRNAGITPPLDALDDGGSAPVHLAVIKQKYDMIEPLKEEGADLNAKNFENESPVELGVSMDDGTMVGVLAHFGAEISDKAIKYAEEEMGRQEIAAALRKARELQKKENAIRQEHAEKSAEEDMQNEMKIELLAAIKTDDLAKAKQLIAQGFEITDDVITYAEKTGKTGAAAGLRKTQEKQKALKAQKAAEEKAIREAEKDLEEPPELDNLVSFPGRDDKLIS